MNNSVENVIYRQPIWDYLPSDSPNKFDPNAILYTPRQYDGPKHKVRRLHSFPRFGYTKDITALVSFRRSEAESDEDVSSDADDLPYDLPPYNFSTPIEYTGDIVTVEFNGEAPSALFNNVPSV